MPLLKINLNIELTILFHEKPDPFSYSLHHFDRLARKISFPCKIPAFMDNTHSILITNRTFATI